MTAEKVYDCIIIGAGPGGLQAAIHLGRFNRDVLLIDRGGGRTGHTRQIENFLSRKSVSGREIIELGIEQAKSFNVQIEKGLVTRVLKKTSFEVHRGDTVDFSRFVIVSSGVYDNFPDIENLHAFLGIGLFTCVDCDGYRTTGKNLVVLGNSIETVHLDFTMKEMYTERITVVLIFYDPPEAYKEELGDEGITLVKGRPTRIIGDEKIEALELKDGR
ncbi:MAG TPA: NAD(P)/FAD-dependent oxidoreductase, partial [Thermodesulfovibrionales bacterium]|nr:NAD(P)/FAD-dependent oxidoreductase [Thermodesulfovibrionales bacterium]